MGGRELEEEVEQFGRLIGRPCTHIFQCTTLFSNLAGQFCLACRIFGNGGRGFEILSKTVASFRHFSSHFWRCLPCEERLELQRGCDCAKEVTCAGNEPCA